MAILVLLIYIALAFFLGKLAEGKGKSFWMWFIIGLVIDPILAFILYFIVSEK